MSHASPPKWRRKSPLFGTVGCLCLTLTFKDFVFEILIVLFISMPWLDLRFPSRAAFKLIEALALGHHVGVGTGQSGGGWPSRNRERLLLLNSRLESPKTPGATHV
jgi:hypothetical protein